MGCWAPGRPRHFWCSEGSLCGALLPSAETRSTRCGTVGFLTYLMSWAAALKISAQSCMSGKDIPEDKGLHQLCSIRGAGRQPCGCLQVAVPPDTWNPRPQMTASAPVYTCAEWPPAPQVLESQLCPFNKRQPTRGPMHRAAPLCRT